MSSRPSLSSKRTLRDTGDATNEDADSDHLGNDNSDASTATLVALQICRATRDAPSSKPFPVGGFSGPRVPHIKWVPSKQQWKEGACVPLIDCKGHLLGLLGSKLRGES
ncbi:hypothetical protein BDZ89DRAFT_1045408 [Hymenopellis radicata]|nr:hypothetical protein BDZ89DRAFT_1045408 [Hymenopellis radicata]